MRADVQPSGRRATPGELRVGCSGWSYRDWRGEIYPERMPQRLWFSHYQTLFDTVELNNTFYRLPTQQAVEQWAEAAAPGFCFALKLGAFGSHRMKLRDAASWLPNHLDRAERLGAHLGPTLVQLPPRWKRNVERLDEFLSVAPRTSRVGPLRWAVELREPSWLHDDVFEVLRRHGAALCLHDLLADHPLELTTDWTYVRFHGPNALEQPYWGPYGPRLLQRWVERLGPLLASGQDVYAYFNNDYQGHAVRDACILRDALGGTHRTAAPADDADGDGGPDDAADADRHGEQRDQRLEQTVRLGVVHHVHREVEYNDEDVTDVDEEVRA